MGTTNPPEHTPLRDLPAKWRDPEHGGHPLNVWAAELEAALPLAEKLASALEDIRAIYAEPTEHGADLKVGNQFADQLDRVDDAAQEALTAWRDGEPAEAVCDVTLMKCVGNENLCATHLTALTDDLMIPADESVLRHGTFQPADTEAK